MVNNPSRESLPGISSDVSAGPETLAPTARGAMLYDASCCGQPDERLFEREGRDWHRFYDAVRVLSEQPQAQRHEALRQLLPNQETPGA